ncbi:MAG: 50S ribosomal protein L28 [Bacteroidetes bacterium ADurb.Bin037]|nr:MAG: 50S ribosomal protein L28 [Bacteroidetes bacterium ADurb.Bin037]HPW77713.1 50S ribosomal protein L28 [Bacteroidales bacterium]HQB55480.1 50S ribosomal protein L28 [Bacteroidales bacterium]
MARVCQVTGKKRMVGNNVSHSKRRTKREFAPNLKTKRFWSEEEGRFITLKVSAAGIRTINKKGLAATLKASREKGLIDIV